MLGFGAIGQFAIGEGPSGLTAETISVDKWFVLLSEPVRFKQGLKPPEQVDFFYQPAPSPFVATGWFEPLSEPVRAPPRSPAALSPYFSFEPLPRVSFSWFELLSEPPRFKPGLKPSEQQFFAIDTTVIPISMLSPWFSPLSEPVRFKPNLGPPRQQFEGRPPQLRPNPATSAVMAAIDTKDTFLGGARVFLRVSSAEIGIIELSFTGSQIGIVEMATTPGAPVSGVIEQAVAPNPGNPVAAITTAHVSIREV